LRSGTVVAHRPSQTDTNGNPATSVWRRCQGVEDRKEERRMCGARSVVEDGQAKAEMAASAAVRMVKVEASMIVCQVRWVGDGG
jgi:hypothetical protein